MGNKKIAIIGAGNMGAALARGLKRSGYCPASSICLSDTDKKKLTALKREQFTVTSDNNKCIENARYVFIVVKPYLAEDILKEITTVLNPNKQILISIAAGIGSKMIREITGKKIPLFLAMPNTAITVNQSATCLSTTNGSKMQITEVTRLFDHMGLTVLIDETQMGAATVIGSCATAFAMRFMRAAMTAGIEIGFKPDTAKHITAQVMRGAADLILINRSNPEDEIDKVSTPGGITITGLNEMEHNGFSSAIIKGMSKAYANVGVHKNKKQ